MQMKVRYKSNNNQVQTGIPLQQWTMPTDAGDMLRIYLLIPFKNADDSYCEVHMVLEEVEEWLVSGKDADYTNRSLSKNELLVIDDQTEEDLYFVWDDGAEEHMTRARRLYEMYKDDIEALSS